MSDKWDIQYAWFQNKPQGWSEYMQFTFCFGFFAGMNGIVGHELVHKKEMVNKILGNWGYTKFLYSHFIDEHLKGHHKNLGTPLDSTTARNGQSLYEFYLQTIPGSHICVWNMEVKRIQKKLGKDAPISLIIFNNKMTWYFLFHVCMLGAIYLVFGWSSVKFQFAYSITGICFLEGINYIEHYGLERKMDEDGIYESITKMHSWNSKSGPVLFRLQRHSDHHAHSFRPYQILRRMDDAPTLPFEYLHSIFLATIPPLWFYLVNPKVNALHELADGKKNIKTKYNHLMPMTKDDKYRQKIGWAVIAIY